MALPFLEAGSPFPPLSEWWPFDTVSGWLEEAFSPSVSSSPVNMPKALQKAYVSQWAESR